MSNPCWTSTSRPFHDSPQFPQRAQLALLDRPQDSPCPDECWLWRVRRIDVACTAALSSNDVAELYVQDRRPIPCPDTPTPFVPDLIAADCSEVVYVAASDSGEILALDLRGIVTGHWRDVFERCQLPLHDLAAQADLAASGAAGIYRIRPAGAERGVGSASIFLTPALVSPDGVESGWSRADIDADFHGRSRIEVRIAHTSDTRTIERIAALPDAEGGPAARLRRLQNALPWDDALTVEFAASEWPAGRPLRVPLHTITSTHLWLMVSSYDHESGQLVTLRSVRVAYPNLSYSSYLPAVFQEDEAAAAQLRSLLCVFESVFGDLDTVLAELPAKIDPATAPEEWLPYLLQWLGLPVAPELAPAEQRQLLRAAPELLRWRGTERALDALLALLLDNDYRVVDRASEAAPWTLPAPGRHAYGARLGADTRVLCLARPGFTIGTSAVLGEAPLGYSEVSTRSLFERTSASLRILVASAANDAAREALVRRFLPYFVPAHCRVDLQFVDAAHLPPPTLLNRQTQFASPGDPRLGSSMVLGRYRTSGCNGAAHTPGMLDGNTIFTTGDYLT